MPKLLIVAILILAGMWIWHEPTIEHGPGVLAGDEPVQASAADPRPFDFRGYSIQPLADFSVHARVLSRKTYRTGRESELAPTDLALGWGPMSDSTVLAPFRFTQSGRWYRYQTDTWTIPKVEVTRHSANMHLIPSSPEIQETLNDVVVGDIVQLSGSLVKVEAADGWKWKSSTTRNDAGAGSCELIWVTEATIN